MTSASVQTFALGHTCGIWRKSRQKLISQPCAAVVNYVQHHKLRTFFQSLTDPQPDALSCSIHQKVIGYRGKIAAISPCVAKIEEFRETGLVDYNVTMEHLKTLL